MDWSQQLLDILALTTGMTSLLTGGVMILRSRVATSVRQDNFERRLGKCLEEVEVELMTLGRIEMSVDQMSRAVTRMEMALHRLDAFIGLRGSVGGANMKALGVDFSRVTEEGDS